MHHKRMKYKICKNFNLLYNEIIFVKHLQIKFNHIRIKYIILGDCDLWYSLKARLMSKHVNVCRFLKA